MNKKIISHLLNYATTEGAKDLVLESGINSFISHYHFPDGTKKSFTLPKKLEKSLLLNLRELLKIAPGELTTKKYCKLADKNHPASFYLTIIPDKNGEKIIINLINKTTKHWRLKQLGLSRKDYQALNAGLQKGSGLIIISSPAQNGKSATLYSLLKQLNNEEKNIYVLSQHPAEKIDGLSQLTLSDNNFNKILRQDPDVIALDEIESDEILKKSFQAASSGLLVIATMAANSYWEVMAKILDLDLPLKLKLDSLKMILNQRLVDLKRPKKTAGKGRFKIGVFELLVLEQAVKDWLLKNDPKSLPAKLKQKS